MHKRASNRSTKNDQDSFTQGNKGTDHCDVPRIRYINEVTIFLLHGPKKYL